MSTVYIRFSDAVREAPQRSPVLERLVAHAAPVTIEDWRMDALCAVAPAVIGTSAAAALSAAMLWRVGGDSASDGVTPARPWGCVATPVHLRAGLTSVHMPADGVLHLGAADAAGLAVDFNRVFGGAEVRMAVSGAGHLLCEFDRVHDVITHDPDMVSGHDVFAFQPSGADAARLRRLMTEIEMWLFDHALNSARGACGQLPVTGLWLWGGGRTGAPRPAASLWAAGADACFGAFGNESEWPREDTVRRAGVVVCAEQPGTAAWREVETRWLGPARAALDAGRIRRVQLSAGHRRVSLQRGGGWRIWRRAVPWWESFNVTGDESNGIQ